MIFFPGELFFPERMRLISNEMNIDEASIADVLMLYNEALNASDTEAVMRLYAEDGVFMPQGSPSSVGAGAVRAAYERVFATIRLQVRFDIAEIRQVAGDWAFARTNSSGTQRVNATGVQTAEGNQELFVMRRVDEQWKIARYCFSSTNAPPS